MKFTSLTYRFLVWFIAISLLPLALFGYLSLRQNEAELRSEILNQMSRLADKKTLQISTYLAERTQDAQLLARSDLAKLAMTDLSHAYTRYRADSAEYRRAAKLFDGNFGAYIGEGTLFYDVFLITPQGEIVYTHKHEPDFATNLVSGPYRDSQLAQVFRESRITLESSISDFDQYSPSNAPAAFVAAPIIREGVLLGVFAFQLDTQRIYQVAMDNIGLGVTGETPLAKLTGADEAVFVAPLRHDPQAAMQRKIDLKAGAVPIRKSLYGERGSGVGTDYAGKQVVAAWRYLPELRWGMVVKMDADEAFAPLYQQRKNLLQALLALAVLGGFVAFYLGRRLVVPLKAFALTAGEIAQGDLDKRVNETRADEIGELGRAFNRMTENLQALYRTLEDRVEERTRELNVSNEQLQEEIIEREHAEADILATRNQLEATIDAIPDLMFEVGLDGTYYDIYAQRRDLLAAPAEDLLGKKVSDVLPAAAAEVAMSALREAQEQGHSHGRQFELPLPQGSLWFELSVSRKPVVSGQQHRFVVLSRDITERKRIENELEKSRDQYDRLTTNIPIGVYLLRTTAKGEYFFKYVSTRFCAMLGVTAESVYADCGVAFQAIHPDDLEGFVKLNQVAVQTREPFQWEGRTLVKGVTKWLRIESKPEPLDNGDCIWDGVMADITERKFVQLELQRNQDLLNEAQRLGQLGSWEMDLVKGELRWSDEIYRLFELDPAQFTPSYDNFLNAIHPDDRDKVNTAYTESLHTRQPYDVEHRLHMADGRIKWVHEHCNSYFDESGKPLRSVGAVQDITARKLNEDSLRIAAVAFETHEGILITDAQATILRINRAFQEITGYGADDVLGKNPRILSSGRQSKEFYTEMWRQLLEKGTWSGEIWDRRKNGEVYPKWLTITAVKDGEGSVTEYVAIFSDITARKRAEEEIRNLAFYDALTGLPNRRLLLDRFHLALSLSARSHHCGALLFLDMDKFKTLNDTMGHDYGDLMLIEVGRRIQACVREVDTVARLGGDEFVALIEEVSVNMQDASQKVALIAEKIRVALTQPYMLKGHEYHSSPSIGVSMYRGSAEPIDVLMKQADMAMYQAKDGGRNTVRFFDPMMQQAVEVHAGLEADLRGALPNQQLQLYYQIQVDGDHRPIGAEALIRWMHPRRGMVSPAQFIPIAEESTLILDIGYWVIEIACRQLVEWAQDEAMRHLVLAVNVSAQQFRLHDFVEQLAELIARHGIAPERLKLELTESVVLEDVADVVAKMHALNALGIRLSLDDFGTGYSSLTYLKQLPLNQIKIDQSFVRDITSDPNDAMMVKTIIDMAQNFRLNVIAEGVETESQLIFLKQNKCMAYQGYLFGRPVPVAEFEALVRRFRGRRQK